MAKPKSKRVVLKGEKFAIARKLADAGIAFIFVHESGGNTVGDVPNQHISKLSKLLSKHPEMEGRFAAHPPRRVTSAPRSKRLKVNPRGRRKNPATFPNRPLSASFKVGDRVELHPATDSWMRGDRYGDIAKVGRDFVYVKLDRSGRTKKFHPKNVNVIEHGGGSFSAGAKRNPVGTFNRSQLDRLAHHYGKIKTINPSGPGYRKLRAYLAELPQAALKQLAGERIKFLSSMARNRVTR
jgi:hypothetical protein